MTITLPKALGKGAQRQPGFSFQGNHYKFPGRRPLTCPTGGGGQGLGGGVSKPTLAGFVLTPVFHLDKQVQRAGALLSYLAALGFGFHDWGLLPRSHRLPLLLAQDSRETPGVLAYTCLGELLLCHMLAV